MVFKMGNDNWKKRSTHGRNPKFSDPDTLWDACSEYFKWIEETPLEKPQPFKVEGQVELKGVPQVRAASLVGLCVFLDISRATWDRYRKQSELKDVANRVEAIIRTQKFEAAAAFMLHPVIISRDLRLGEREAESEVVDGAKETELKVHAEDVSRRILNEAAPGEEEGSA